MRKRMSLTLMVTETLFLFVTSCFSVNPRKYCSHSFCDIGFPFNAATYIAWIMLPVLSNAHCLRNSVTCSTKSGLLFQLAGVLIPML